jgi:hypothetical protein
VGERREKEVWEIVNRERNRRKGVNGEIGMEEWVEYFRRLLGGVEERVVKGEGRRRTGEERGISRGEIRGTIRRIRDGKAAGIDGIPGRCENTGERSWRNGYGNFARGYGMGRDGRRNGKRE